MQKSKAGQKRKSLMDKQKSYSIQEVSALLNIPKATIRYWDREGLINPERNRENDYREFPLQVVMELGNISFLRSLDIPVKAVKQMLESDIGVQKELLEEADLRIEEKIRELHRQKERLLLQKHALEEVRRLQEERMEPVWPAFQKAVLFERDREAHWKRMIEQPGAFVLLFECRNPEKFQYGIGYEAHSAIPGEKEIWRMGDHAYLERLLITHTYDESRNNLAGQLEKIEKAGIYTGSVIAQYLTSGVKGEGEVSDYYKMWIEIKAD